MAVEKVIQNVSTAAEYAKMRLEQEAHVARQAEAKLDQVKNAIVGVAASTPPDAIPFVGGLLARFKEATNIDLAGALARDSSTIKGTMLPTAVAKAIPAEVGDLKLRNKDPELAKLCAAEGLTGDPTIADLEFWLTSCNISSVCASQRRYEIAARFLRVLQNASNDDAVAMRNGLSSTKIARAAAGTLGAFASPADADSAMLRLIEEVDLGKTSAHEAFLEVMNALSMTKSDVAADVRRRYAATLTEWNFALPERVEFAGFGEAQESELVRQLAQLDTMSVAGLGAAGAISAIASLALKLQNSSLPADRKQVLWSELRDKVSTLASGSATPKQRERLLAAITQVPGVPKDLLDSLATLTNKDRAGRSPEIVVNTPVAGATKGLSASYRKAESYASGERETGINALTLTLASNLQTLN